MELNLTLHDETETLALGNQLAKLISAPMTLFLQGDLGVGKTTLVRGILQGLGVQQAIKSPTYTIVEPYPFDAYNLYHFDFYRIENKHELYAIGIEDYFQADSICLIEWPERAPNLIHPVDIVCQMHLVNNGRSISFTTATKAGDQLVSQIR